MASQCCLYYQFICCLYNHYIPSCRPYSPSLPFQPVHQWTSRLQVVIIPPVERNVIVGNSVVFVCQVNGKVITADNSYRWKWSKDNGEDLPTDVRIFFGYLTIYNVQPYHTGRYLCEVERMGLKGLAETKLTVQTASTSLAVSGLQMIPSRQTVTRGKTGRFECRLTSETDKETNLTWSFGSQKQLREGIQTSNGVLTIDNVESRDEGDYFCTAQLTNGQAFAKGHLTVVNATGKKLPRNTSFF